MGYSTEGQGEAEREKKSTRGPDTRRVRLWPSALSIPVGNSENRGPCLGPPARASSPERPRARRVSVYLLVAGKYIFCSLRVSKRLLTPILVENKCPSENVWIMYSIHFKNKN